MPLRWKRRQIGELVCDRDTPFSDDDRALLEAIAHHAAVALEHGRAVMRGVLAQEIHHRVKNNLQTVASLLRLQARSPNADPQKALGDSVNRILAIAAVHEVLTEHREDDVDLAELIERLRAMLVQGLAAGKEVEAVLEPVSLAGQRATALALVFSELFQNALEHGGGTVRIELAQQRRRRRALDRRRRRRPERRRRRHRPLDRARARARRARGHARADERAGAARPGGVPGMKILIAEDETIIRMDLRALLEGAGFEVCAEAKDGEEAVELARSEQPDLAVLDVKMPRLDGIEAARRILDERPIPIVMVTAYGERELVARAVEAGVFGYLVKPFRETDLLPAIETARARHEELTALREEAESLADALAARKSIERAKGLLMAKEGLSEQDAFARLRKASQVSGRPLKVVAEAVVATLDPGGERASERANAREGFGRFVQRAPGVWRVRLDPCDRSGHAGDRRSDMSGSEVAARAERARGRPPHARRGAGGAESCRGDRRDRDGGGAGLRRRDRGGGPPPRRRRREPRSLRPDSGRRGDRRQVERAGRADPGRRHGHRHPRRRAGRGRADGRAGSDGHERPRRASGAPRGGWSRSA